MNDGMEKAYRKFVMSRAKSGEAISKSLNITEVAAIELALVEIVDLGNRIDRLKKSLIYTTKDTGDEALSSVDAHRVHMLLGIAGEVGELVENYVREIFAGQHPDQRNKAEEFGDITFYLFGLLESEGILLPDVLLANVDKLTKRYKDGYSDAAAILRADKAEGEA